MESLTLALVQTEIHWENIDANLADLEEQIWRIDDDVDIILLPENFNAGFTDNIEKIAEVPGLKSQKWLQQMADQKNAMVAGSLLIREGQNIFNRFVVATPNAKLQHYSKRHLFNLSNIEARLTAGEKRTIIKYKGWRICPMICYDLRFPIWSRNRILADGKIDYDLLIYVANWPEARIDQWDALLRARAIENQSYVAAVNRVGIDDKGLNYVGHTSVYDYTGQELSKAKNEPNVLIQTIDKGGMAAYRQKLPFLADERA